MLLFVVSIVPATFGAEVASLTSEEPTATLANGVSVENYIEENSEEIDTSNLDRCFKAVKKKFPKLLDMLAKEQCLKD